MPLPPQGAAAARPPARLPLAPALLRLVLLPLLLLAVAGPELAAAEPTAVLLAHRRSLLQPGPLVTITSECAEPIRVFTAFPIGDWTPGGSSGTGCCTDKASAAATGTCVEELTEHRTPALSTEYDNADTSFVSLNETVQSCWYTNPGLQNATSTVLVGVQSNATIVPTLQTDTGSTSAVQYLLEDGQTPCTPGAAAGCLAWLLVRRHYGKRARLPLLRTAPDVSLVATLPTQLDEFVPTASIACTVTAPAPEPDTLDVNTSSAVPVGAIVGGVVAGCCLLAVLAFLALRPSKGWLRRKPHAAAAPAGLIELTQAPRLSGSQDHDGSGADPLALPRPESLPASHGTDASQWRDALASDPTLSFINSQLASQRRPRRRPAGAAPSAGPGAASMLRPEVRQWEVQWEELEIVRPIGRGSFGAVYAALWHQTMVAVKVLLIRGDSGPEGLLLPDATMAALQAEAGVLSALRHPNCIQFMGLCALPPAIITEYCSRGSLYDSLAAARASPAAAAELPWRRRLGLAADAATGIYWLHSKGVIHRDVKSPNLLIDDTWRCKVADLNLSKILETQGAHPGSDSSGVANPCWLAPEVLRGGRATAASDVFAFGVVLWELLTWRLPWADSGQSVYMIGRTVLDGGRLPLPGPGELPGPEGAAAFEGLDAYVELLQACWAQAPEARPPLSAVVPRLRALLDLAP